MAVRPRNRVVKYKYNTSDTPTDGVYLQLHQLWDSINARVITEQV